MEKYDGQLRSNKVGDKCRFSITQDANSTIKPMEYHDNGTRFPLQLVKVKRDSMYDERIHPTQKPVSLLEYFIKTYTDEGEIILDNCMGSGTTAIACLNTNRHFIGFEFNDEYWKKANERIDVIMCQTKLF